MKVEVANQNLNVCLYAGTIDHSWSPIPPYLKHHVWKVALKKSCLQYSLDLTSAQYGYSNPAVPWGEYSQTRCSKHEVSPAGIVETLWNLNCLDSPELSQMCKIWEMYVAKLNRAVTKWEADNMLGLSTNLRPLRLEEHEG